MSQISVSRRQILAGAAVAVPVGAMAFVAPTEADAATEQETATPPSRSLPATSASSTPE